MHTTLLKGLAVLEELAESQEPSGPTQLAAKLKLAKSNVHQLLQTLVHGGYARKDVDSGRYVCTLKVWQLGTHVAERLDIRRVAKEQVRQLAESTSETVHLTVLDGTQAINVDKIDSLHAVRTQMGIQAPAYTLATGKALLAHAPAQFVEAVMKNLVRHTSGTITDPKELRKDLARVRERGYSVSHAEWLEGVYAVAAPIFSHQGMAVAAIGVSAPTERMSAKRMRELAPAVMQAAREVSLAMGFRQLAA